MGKHAKRIRQMVREIKRRGGMIHVDKRVPEEMMLQFLQQILDCPDCASEAREKPGATAKEWTH